MSALNQMTTVHRNTLRTALGHPQVAQDIYDILNGTGRPGTKNTDATVDERSSESHITTLTFTSKSITTTDGGANGAIGSLAMYTFPEGMIRINGCVINMTFTCSAEITTALKFSVGSAPAATNDTLDLTKANVIESTAGTVTAGAGSLIGVSKATAITALTDSSGGTANDTVAALADGTTYANDVAAIRSNFADLTAKVNALIAVNTLKGNPLHVVLDGTSSAAILYLNIGVVNANSSGNGSVTVTGTAVIDWTWMGDK